MNKLNVYIDALTHQRQIGLKGKITLYAGYFKQYHLNQ